ncbi:MAG: hypothetical protein ACLFMP_05930 [Desulfonatronovibrionaceae bacterium]
MPENIGRAPMQRQEFVTLFLRGWWGEAEAAFRMSVDNFISQDDFCSAARNYVLAHRLLKYAGGSDPGLLQKARDLQKTGQSCPRVLDDSGHPVSSLKSREYSARLEELQKMEKILQKESDPLYVSVYARKAADRALNQGNRELAKRFLQMAREMDSKRGWVVFLIRDWEGLLALEDDREQKEEIKKRIDYLQALISPGEEVFVHERSGNSG